MEGRLMAMLEHVPDLTLAFLNEATQAWVEYEYNRKIHSEIGEAPITRFLAGPEVMRPCPGSDALRLAFTRSDHRMQRKSDGTNWDLGLVHLIDERTGNVLSRLYPQDKTKNASGLRRSLEPGTAEPLPAQPATGIAPLLADRQPSRNRSAAILSAQA